MTTFEEIYNATPFEDEHGELIPHDKVAKMAAVKFGREIIVDIISNIDVPNYPLSGPMINKLYIDSIQNTLMKLTL